LPFSTTTSGHTAEISSLLVTTSPTRSTGAIRMSSARPPSAIGLSAFLSSLSAGYRLSGPRIDDEAHHLTIRVRDDRRDKDQQHYPPSRERSGIGFDVRSPCHRPSGPPSADGSISSASGYAASAPSGTGFTGGWTTNPATSASGIFLSWAMMRRTLISHIRP
jgi:hypothetical protein